VAVEQLFGGTDSRPGRFELLVVSTFISEGTAWRRRRAAGQGFDSMAALAERSDDLMSMAVRLVATLDESVAMLGGQFASQP
jgi:hypothetical protein